MPIFNQLLPNFDNCQQLTCYVSIVKIINWQLLIKITILSVYLGCGVADRARRVAGDADDRGRDGVGQAWHEDGSHGRLRPHGPLHLRVRGLKETEVVQRHSRARRRWRHVAADKGQLGSLQDTVEHFVWVEEIWGIFVNLNFVGIKVDKINDVMSCAQVIPLWKCLKIIHCSFSSCKKVVFHSNYRIIAHDRFDIIFSH